MNFVIPADLFNAIEDPKATREDIGDLYGALLRTPGMNWGAVNRAILDRYSRSGLEYIKARAWKSASGTAR